MIGWWFANKLFDSFCLLGTNPKGLCVFSDNTLRTWWGQYSLNIGYSPELILNLTILTWRVRCEHLKQGFAVEDSSWIARDVPPLRPNSFFFLQFSAKICKMVGATLLGLGVGSWNPSLESRCHQKFKHRHKWPPKCTPISDVVKFWKFVAHRGQWLKT